MLTDDDKKSIKKAILKAVENGCTEPELLLTKIFNAFERVDMHGRVVKGNV